MTKYQHYKGGIYTVLTTRATHTETNERVVVYRNEEGGVFVRPRDMFFEDVEVDGVMVPRFKEIKRSCGVIMVDSIRDYKPSPLTSSQEKFRDMLYNPKPKENYVSNILKKYGRNG